MQIYVPFLFRTVIHAIIAAPPPTKYHDQGKVLKTGKKTVASTGFWDQFESVKDKKSAPAVEGGERQAENLARCKKQEIDKKIHKQRECEEMTLK